MKKKILNLIVLLIVVSCNTVVESKHNESLNFNYEINISITRGGGFEAPVEDTLKFKKYFESDSLRDLIYTFRLDTNGKLIICKGIGYYDANFVIHFIDTLQINEDFIAKKTLNKINYFAHNIYKDWQSFYNKDYVTDSWLGNLRIKDKNYVYFVGQELLDNDTLSPSFDKIMNEFVKNSFIKIEDWEYW